MNTQTQNIASKLTELHHWINGCSVPPVSGQFIETVSPMTGVVSLKVAAGNEVDVDAAAQAAKTAAEAWRRFNPAERGRLMLCLLYTSDAADE